MTNAAEEAAARLDMREQDLLGLGAPPQVGRADDAGNARAPAVAGLFGDPAHELGLAHRAQVRRPVRPIGAEAFDIDRGLHPMAGAGVGAQVVQQIGLTPFAGPQMMVRIDDDPVRLQDRLGDGRFGQCAVLPVETRLLRPSIRRSALQGEALQPTASLGLA
jgi:hypothetical protein